VRTTHGVKPLAVLLLPTSRGEERQYELDQMVEAMRACGDILELLIPELYQDTSEYDIKQVRTLLRSTNARYVLPCQRPISFDQRGLARFIDALEGVDADVVCPITVVGDPLAGDVSEHVLELPLGSAASVELYQQSTAAGHLVVLKCDSLLAQDTLEISDITKNSRIVANALGKRRSIIAVPEVLGVVSPCPEQDYAQDEFEASLERLESFEYRQLPPWQQELLQYSLGLFHRLGSDILRDPSPSEAGNRLPELFVASSQVILRADPMVGFNSLQEHSGVIEPHVGRAYSFRCDGKPAQILMYHSMLSGSKTVIVKLSVYAQYSAMISLRYLKNSDSTFSTHREASVRVPQGQSTVFIRFDVVKCQGFVTLNIVMQPGTFEIHELELRRCFIPGFGRASRSTRQPGVRSAPRTRLATVRFVILFEGRTGSTHLTQWIDSLHDVRCLPESLEKLSSQGQLWWIRRLFIEASTSLQAIGFKTKLRDVKDTEEFRRIIHEFGCRVLYMTRRNVIKAVLSTMNAERRFAATGEWNQLPGMPILGPLEVSPQQMDDYLRFRLENEARLAQFIESLESPIMKLDYEELLRDEDAVLQSVCEFLGITSREGSSHILKQTDDDLTKALLNYDELRAYYRATPYEEMF
jgi:LPS sulfotransferase NodH